MTKSSECMPDMHDIRSASDLRFGNDPQLDAWVLHFMTENNLEYLLNPFLNASPEQLRFMVAMDEDQIYAPCSDEVFRGLLAAEAPPELLQSYETVWRVVERLIEQNIEDRYMRQRIRILCRHRYNLVKDSHIVIPSRLMKRLASIVLTQSGLQDPYRERKKLHNQRVENFIHSPMFDRVVSVCHEHAHCGRIEDLRWELDLMELQRLFVLSGWGAIWHGGEEPPAIEAMEKECGRPFHGAEHLTTTLGPGSGGPKKILYIPRTSGAVMFDILIAKTLLRLGHQVIMALKEGFYFQAPALWDMEHDPALSRALADAYVLAEDRVSKNKLLRLLREHRFVVISDGTVERLNLYRVNVTFARAWKEADLIITKGHSNVRRFIECDHQFTRDILCLQRRFNRECEVLFKPRPDSLRKITEQDLRTKSEQIIRSMRQAKQEGDTVMFYSAIVGSIPGETSTAIKVLNTFVDHLRKKLDGTFIINPAEHFEPGMDGDDLMYMWERVQRSGLLDVWRFQTVNDIERSFDLMGEKVPSLWSGKDSTYSTGCTKEMKIALDMQSRQPELQIIGPSPDKFFRRRDYGVGKYFDAGIEYQ